MPNGLRITEVSENELEWEFQPPDSRLWRGKILPNDQDDGEGWLITELFPVDPIRPMPLEELAIRADYEVTVIQAQGASPEERRKKELDAFFVDV